MTVDPASLGFELLPPDPSIITPDLALDAALAPTAVLADDTVDPLGKGWAFDFINNQFMRVGHAPQAVYGVSQLLCWVEKTLRTGRYAHAIYGDDYGVAGGPYQLVGEDPADDLLAEYQEAVIEALTVHDRIAAVEDFVFNQDPYDDSLYVSFSLVLDEAGDVEGQTLNVTDLPVPEF